MIKSRSAHSALIFKALSTFWAEFYYIYMHTSFSIILPYTFFIETIIIVE